MELLKMDRGKEMRQIKGDSEEPEIGIEWENGVYLSSKPSRIDFQGIREDYGGAKLEKDREDIRLEQEDYFTQLHKLANNPHCSEDIRELLSEIMRVEFCTDKMDKFHQNLSAGIYDEDSEMKVFPVTVSKDMESVLSVRGIDLEDAIEVATNEWNVEAIILKQLESEGRLATAEEQKTLSLYARWGGIPQAFDGKNNDWSKEYTLPSTLLPSPILPNPKMTSASNSFQSHKHKPLPLIIQSSLSPVFP